MKKYKLTISFDSIEEASRFTYLVCQMAAGACGLRSIAVAMRQRLAKADLNLGEEKRNILKIC